MKSKKFINKKSDISKLVEKWSVGGFSISVDTETTGLAAMVDWVVGIGLCDGEEVVYIPTLFLVPQLSPYPYESEVDTEDIQKLFEAVNKNEVVAHNWLFDAKMIETSFNVQLNLTACTMTALRLMGKPAGLKDAMFYELGWTEESVNFSDLLKHHYGVTHKSKSKNGAHLPVEGDWGVGIYCMKDAQATWELYHKIKGNIAETSLKTIFKLEMKVLKVAKKLALTGVPVDNERLSEAAVEVGRYLDAKNKELEDIYGEPFNSAKPSDVSKLLFDKLGLEPIKSSPKTGRPSADKETITHLMGGHPAVELLSEVREVSKALSTYLIKLPHNTLRGKVYSNFSPTGAESGRWTSSSEDTHKKETFGTNLQAISKKVLHYTSEGVNKKVSIRESFIAPPGYTWVRLDYHQIEPRVQANISGEDFLIKAFNRGYDSHTTTASLAFNKTIEEVEEDTKSGGSLRKKGKVINLALSYGMGANSLAKKVGCTVFEADEFMGNFWAKMPQVREKMDYYINMAITMGHVKTYFGRIRKLSEWGDKRKLARQAWNSVIQGTAADILKIGMVRLNGYLETLPKEVAQMVLTVHDEVDLIIQTEYLEEVLPKIVMNFEVPVPKNWVAFPADVGYGPNWSEASHTSYKHGTQQVFTKWNDVLNPIL